MLLAVFFDGEYRVTAQKRIDSMEFKRRKNKYFHAAGLLIAAKITCIF